MHIFVLYCCDRTTEQSILFALLLRRSRTLGSGVARWLWCRSCGRLVVLGPALAVVVAVRIGVGARQLDGDTTRQNRGHVGQTDTAALALLGLLHLAQFDTYADTSHIKNLIARI